MRLFRKRWGKSPGAKSASLDTQPAADTGRRREKREAMSRHLSIRGRLRIIPARKLAPVAARQHCELCLIST